MTLCLLPGSASRAFRYENLLKALHPNAPPFSDIVQPHPARRCMSAIRVSPRLNFLFALKLLMRDGLAMKATYSSCRRSLPRFRPPQVKNMIKFRQELPQGAHLLVTKNTLMVKASEGTKWEAISECATGMNAWLFVDENISPAIKVVKSLQKDWKKDGVEVDFTGAVLDGKFIDSAGISALEKLPTKKDLITMVALGIKQVPTKLARGSNGVPLKLAHGVKAIADGKSDIVSA